MREAVHLAELRVQRPGPDNLPFPSACPFRRLGIAVMFAAIACNNHLRLSKATSADLIRILLLAETVGSAECHVDVWSEFCEVFLVRILPWHPIVVRVGHSRR
jgi:hypothetical protein